MWFTLADHMDTILEQSGTLYYQLVQVQRICTICTHSLKLVKGSRFYRQVASRKIAYLTPLQLRYFGQWLPLTGVALCNLHRKLKRSCEDYYQFQHIQNFLNQFLMFNTLVSRYVSSIETSQQLLQRLPYHNGVDDYFLTKREFVASTFSLLKEIRFIWDWLKFPKFTQYPSVCTKLEVLFTLDADYSQVRDIDLDEVRNMQRFGYHRLSRSLHLAHSRFWERFASPHAIVRLSIV